MNSSVSSTDWVVVSLPTMVLDINKDRWVIGTPLRYRVGDGHPELEKIDLGEIRQRARNKAEPFLKSLGMIEPGVPVFVSALGDPRKATGSD